MLEFLATTSKFFTLKPLSLRNAQVSLSTYENDFLLLLIIIVIIFACSVYLLLTILYY